MRKLQLSRGSVAVLHKILSYAISWSRGWDIIDFWAELEVGPPSPPPPAPKAPKSTLFSLTHLGREPVLSSVAASAML
jgi:hypothetical protein